ncbi:efflux RND transporter periplasmic adaptor subunit [Rhodobacteraceae bacterium CCMM004]|nr:efflux RND transporter periplasmic adaptor subunit [Rhodobacteraceae bacterium CCMM004]
MSDAPQSQTARLEFASDRGAGRSKWVAAALILLLVGWMGSGFFTGPPPPAPQDQGVVRQPVAVAVRDSAARPVPQVFVAEGQALPARDTTVIAELTGQIVAVPAVRGAKVAAGDVLAQFDRDRLEADAARAEEELNRAQREFDNASTLLDRGTATVDRVAEARAGLAAATAGLAAARQALDDTVVRAPFAGLVEDVMVEVNEFAAAGSPLARIVDTQPLTVDIQVPQQSRSALREGQAAEVRFITGETATGEVVFVGASADAQTRTFTAEIEVPNAGGAIPAGVSAEVRIVYGEEVAHFLSPATLSLGADGTLGVKIVEGDNVVAFYPVNIVRAQTDGLWVTGLPPEARVIVVGQGFVNAGETVNPQPESVTARAPEPEG